MAKSITHEFVKGLWEEVPPFRLVLGLCPTLGVTTKMQFGIGMGLATTFVLVCANILVSMLRKAVPPKVRIACFIIIIATFVTLVELLMQAFAYPLFLQLGIFIPLIVVNCIVLGRAEAFASKNGLFLSIADGLGIGIGFTLSLAALGALREILGAGTITLWEGIELVNLTSIFPGFQPFQFMVQAPGAFICLGIMLCGMNMVGNR
ncbi:MAG: electron transport complex subunit E [Desulfobacterales bacterium]|nr:electron transport complex subunit E [Desulfobacterales bacterium]MDJ0873733.1 electron transport complex subunit E [Desulfobacterales bacterium]MDJ0883245.1 electron transport complex subunit E [Desulfobacterales bacterium]